VSGVSWKDRLADVAARLFVTAPDHPERGGFADTDDEEQPEGES
jgi:hypothetical protein